MNNKKWIIFAVLTAILVLLTAGQSYKEDISDFLPLENEQQEAFMEYQNTSSARRIYVIFQSADNGCQPAVDLFTERAEQLTTKSQKPLAILQGDDPEVVQEAMNTIYARMPYLLTADDYARIDSMTEASDFIARQLENDKQMLMLPSGGMAALQIRHDPLNLFASVLARQKPTNQANSVMLLIDSPFGASETEHNAALVAMLQQVCDSVSLQFPDVSVRLTGGPVIAVGNAQQIKKDSIISITFAVILILLLLWLVFRNVRNMMLIAVSIAWGWLFAMGCLTLVHNDVSIIVIGISSVILGIAVNYPLHLIAHLSHTTDVQTALKEIRMPLVVGNVTPSERFWHWYRCSRWHCATWGFSAHTCSSAPSSSYSYGCPTWCRRGQTSAIIACHTQTFRSENHQPSDFSNDSAMCSWRTSGGLSGWLLL